MFAYRVGCAFGPGAVAGFLANGGISPAFGLAGTTPAQLRAATSSYIPDQKLPYAINYNLTVQHVFAKDYTLDVGYIGTKGVHLITQQQLNRQSPVTATPSRSAGTV